MPIVVYPYHPELPPKVTSAWVGQRPPSDPTFLGVLYLCANSTNPNDINVYTTIWIDIYVVDPNGLLKPVDKQGPTAPDVITPHDEFNSASTSHPVLANETVSNGSTNFAIRFATEILAGDDENQHFSPPLVGDKWVNVTFTPYGSGTLYRDEGKPCLRAYD